MELLSQEAQQELLDNLIKSVDELANVKAKALAKPYFNRKQAAAFCGMSPVSFDTYVRPYVKAVVIPGYTKVVWNRATLDKFMRELEK
ncbi:hypothetical protein [Ligilactobacillus equi]|uniref:DNA-binding protein n=1 Tax=Ligilactobacillus equi DPC 6820 TaxID=1392007 RepID=V7HWS4_9LACO|nr:hypothetical protein [Ligilactobacillus equi]ETA73476.1 hypothetical protein LEQ_1848 [Ligilactobacillus equi DPC 6820]